MNQRIELPYYFEVPEMPEIPFDVQQYFVSEQQRHEAQDDVKTQDNKNVFNKDFASKVLSSYLFVLAPWWSRIMRDET